MNETKTNWRYVAGTGDKGFLDGKDVENQIPTLPKLEDLTKREACQAVQDAINSSVCREKGIIDIIIKSEEGGEIKVTSKFIHYNRIISII